MEWSRESLLETLSGVRMWSRGAERAPHKPLLLLLTLAQIQRSGAAGVKFKDVERPLSELLDQFGPPRQRNNPVYPFWRLQNDRLWQVTGSEPIFAKPEREPTVTELREKDAEGHFVPEVADLLSGDGELLISAAQLLLDENFPPSIHEDILEAVGLVANARTFPMARVARRDPRFARSVLEAYEYRCAVCGYDGQLTSRVVGLEAAHVKWFAFGGPDSVENGIGLCSLHHKALDMGAIGISAERTVLISQAFRGSTQWQALFARYSGRPLLGPQPGQRPVAAEFQRWHFQEVFRGPERPPPPTSETEVDTPQQAT